MMCVWLTPAGHSQRRAAAAGGDAGAGGGAGVYGRCGRAQAAYSARPHVCRLVRARRRVCACVLSVLTLCSGRHFVCCTRSLARSSHSSNKSSSAATLGTAICCESHESFEALFKATYNLVFYFSNTFFTIELFSSFTHKLYILRIRVQLHIHKHRFYYTLLILRIYYR